MSKDHDAMRRTIEQYLQGRLSGDEEEAFEAAYLGDRELLDELVLAQQMQQGFKALATNDGATFVDSNAEPGRQRFWATPQYAAAASILLVASAMFSGLLYQDNQQLRLASPAIVAENPTRLVPLIAVRGQGQIELAQPSADEWTVLLADPGFTPYEDYEVIVTRMGVADPVWQLEGMSRTYEDLLAIGMPGRLLTPGDYSIALSGRMRDWTADRGSENAGTFGLQVVAAAQ